MENKMFDHLIILESVATEFDIQGLELDWVCVTWDADFRYTQMVGNIDHL